MSYTVGLQVHLASHSGGSGPPWVQARGRGRRRGSGRIGVLVAGKQVWILPIIGVGDKIKSVRDVKSSRESVD